jgi:tRNA (guanine-N7-)-methyltransferase
MAQKKLVRFAELETFSNVLQYPEQMPGTWNEFFGNSHPLVLELACGKGEYTLGLAAMYPSKNFLGVDLKGNRLWVGARMAMQQNLKNAAFLRIQIDRLTEFFGTEEVDEIWITFPDPQLRISKSKKRLTHPKFLRLYYEVLKPNGRIHLKTDSPQLYQFTRRVIDMYGCTLHHDLDDVYGTPGISPELHIKTHYEGLDIAGSNRVHYLCFSLPAHLPSREMDATLQQLLKDEAGELNEDEA